MTTVISSHAKPRPPAVPIDVLNSDTARLYTHLHPALVLSLYAYQFRAIVADPVPALATTLVPLSLLQVVYVAICLPPTGGTAHVDRRKAGDKRKAAPGKTENSAYGKMIPAFLSLAISSVLVAPLLTATLVLFGAPITTHHAHTLLCGAHISFLATLPLVYVHGVDGDKWRDIVALLLPIDDIYGAMMGTVLGAWLGAIPIPLDWDREWQKWPVTIVTGAYAGYAAGKLLGGTVLKGKKIMFE